MSERSSDEGSSSDVQEAIARACRQYRSERGDPHATSLEVLLTSLPDALQSAALSELIKIDLDETLSQDDHDIFESYLRRFSNHEDAVRAAFGRENSQEREDPERTLHRKSPTLHAAGSNTPRDGLRVLCPHCHHSVVASDEDPLRELCCDQCGKSFEIASAMSSPRAGVKLGQFELIEVVGNGSFGIVWRARDLKLDRVVAIKVPRRTELDETETQRFLREARAAGQLTHANITAVHEVGRHESIVYIVSDLIEGETLAEKLARGDLERKSLVRMCSKIARALHFAHERGIVHRDIKPSNVLLDAGQEPHVTDFGLAKRSSVDGTWTLDGKMIGTPAYMSPEQAAGKAYLADSRTDLYALGVILYEGLAGARPFEGEISELLPKILYDDPPRPRKLDRTIPRDLETICLKCLRKAPSQRYASASDLADDLDRYLEGERVLARPMGMVERSTRWISRNRTIAASGLIIVMALIFVLFNQFRASRRVRESLSESQAAQGVLRLEAGDPQGLLDLIESAKNAPRTNAARHSRGKIWASWYHDWQDRLVAVVGHDKAISSFDISADGSQLLTSSDDGTVVIWSVEDGTILHGPFRHSGNVYAATWLWNDELIATSSLDAETSRNVLKIWQCENADRPVFVRPTEGPQVSFAAENGVLVFLPDPETLKIVNRLESGQFDERDMDISELNGPATEVQLDASGRFVAIGSSEGKVAVWDLESSRKMFQAHHGDSEFSDPIDDIAFSPNLELLAIAGQGLNSVAVWDWQDESRSIATLHLAHEEDVKSIDFSPDGSLLLSGSYDATARLWRVDTGRLVVPPFGHRGPVTNVCFSPDGELFATGGFDGSGNVWRLNDDGTTSPLRWQFQHQGVIRQLSFTADSRKIVSSASDMTARVWRVSEDRAHGIELGHTSRVWDVSFSQDGDFLATASSNGLRIWRRENETGLFRLDTDLRRNLPGMREILSVSFDATEDRLVLGGGQLIEVLTREGNEWSSQTNSAEGQVRDIVMGRSTGELLAVGGTIWQVDAASAKVQAWDPPGGEMAQGAFDGRNHLAVACTDKAIRIWDVDQRERVKEIQLNADVETVAFSRDGSILASGGRDFTVRFWRTDDYRQTDSLIRLTSIPQSIDFSADNRLVAISLTDKTTRLFDVETGLQCGPALPIAGFGTGTQFSPSGDSLASGTLAKVAHVWTLPWLNDDPRSTEYMEIATWVAIGARMRPNGTVEPISWREWQDLKRKLDRLDQ